MNVCRALYTTYLQSCSVAQYVYEKEVYGNLEIEGCIDNKLRKQ